MDLGPVGGREAQRVFGNSENICFEKSVIRNGVKSVNPCEIRAVARVSGNKKPQLITVGVSYLVEMAGLELGSYGYSLVFFNLYKSIAYNIFVLTSSQELSLFTRLSGGLNGGL